MSIQGNSPKPRVSISSSRNHDDLGDLELPERSRLKIVINPLASQASLKESQNQEIDEEFYNLELLPDSHIMSKQNGTVTTSTTFVSQKFDSMNQPKNVTKPAEEALVKTTRNTSPNKKQVDSNVNAVQKSKKTSVKLKGNRDEQSFNDNNQISQCLQNAEQMEIRKKIEQKIKNGYNYEKQGGGLKAKAQQLRRQNQLRQRVLNMPNEKYLEKKTVIFTENHIKTRQANQQIKQNPKLKVQRSKVEITVDNNYDNISNKQGNKHGLFEIKTRQMTIQSIIYYYQKQFKFNESNISNELIGRSQKVIQEQQQSSIGFSICSCFKSSKRRNISNYNIPLAKRLVAISKKQVTNCELQQSILKQIWSSFTNKQFMRYGSNWIELGFQGRDPFTDLRSTGILSLLQWLQFIQLHPKISDKYYIWSLSHYYPMALTFIQITDIFLDLLSKGAIKSENWDGFQRCYNCIVLGMFQKLIERYKLGELVPNFVQNQANEVKKQFKNLLSAYEQEFKKMR